MYDDDEIPQPDSCIECGEIAIGYDQDGTPFCSEHYRARMATPAIQRHVHTRECYDDPGPGDGYPGLICGKTTRDLE